MFDFGLVESLGVASGLDDAAGAGDLREIEVEVTAVVADVAAATAGAALTNTATVQVFDPDDAGTELTDPDNPTTASETIDVVEPELIIEKTSPIAIGQGDQVAYEVVIRHDPDSSGPAFDLLVTDALDDPFLAFDAGSVAVAGVAGAVVTEVGTGFEVTIPVLDVGESVTITYTATLDAAAPEAESFFNTADLVYDSAPGDGGRAQTAEDTARVATVPAIDKTLDSTSFGETADPELGLGEVATYRIEIFLPEVLNEDVTVTDTLPVGLTPLAGGVRIIEVGGQLSENGGGAVTDLFAPEIVIAGQTVTVAFEDIDNAFDGVVDTGDRIVIEIDAVVDADLAQNPDGTALENTAALGLTAGGTDFSVEDPEEITVVVPDLALTKSADPAGDVDAGDVVTFTVEIANTGTGPAYDLAIEDLMSDAGLSLVPGSVSASDGSAAVEVANGDGTLGFTLDVPLVDAGETLVITYQAVVQDAAEFNGQVENQARIVSFDTNPGEAGDGGFVDEVTFVSDPDDPDDPLLDTAVVTTVGVELSKETSAGATSEGETG
ncbi:MAG: isopeptide-forming domain-containing fimbrial protein, partial [Myxococcota bacterium]